MAKNRERIGESNTQAPRASKKLFAYPSMCACKVARGCGGGGDRGAKKTELKNSRARMAIDRRRGEVASDGCQRC